MNGLISSFQLFLDRFLVPLDDPGSRLFYVNAIMTLVFLFAFAVLSRPKGSVQSLLSILQGWIFRKRYWWNSSTQVDYKIYLINGLLKAFIFIPWLDLSYFFSKNTVVILQIIFKDFPTGATTTMSLLVFTVLAFVWDDFLRFSHHWCMHKVPWLWSFHQTHHSAKILTPITLYRAHPVEVMIATVRNALSAGVATGFFVFIFESQVSYFHILSVNLFGFAFNFLGSNLRHSHIPLSFGFLEALLISPLQHQIHHSQNQSHFDKNFGVSLAIWDRLIGTWVPSRQGHAPLRFGLRGVRAHRLRDLLFPSFKR